MLKEMRRSFRDSFFEADFVQKSIDAVDIDLLKMAKCF
jgi:hypothetical protein